MEITATTTTIRPRAEVERAWAHDDDAAALRELGDVAVSFREAPGDRGTEIHVTLTTNVPGGVLGAAVGKLTGSDPRARAHDHLRRFKQMLETGEIARSDGAPHGSRVADQPKQHPAQPVEEVPA